MLERPYPHLLGSQSGVVDALPSSLKFDAQPFFNLGAPVNSDSRLCLGIEPFFKNVCYAVSLTLSLQECMSENKGRPCANFFQKGGSTTVEVLNLASSFGVGFSPYPHI